MSERQTPHLQDDELLTLLDGEMPERDAFEFRSHMEACWTCQTRMEEMKNTIGEYVRYRDAIRPLFPPPASWGDLQPALEQVDRSLAPAPLTPPRRRMHLFAWRPAYWLAAAALILVFVLARRLEQVPAVSAAELLRKASAVEQKPAPLRRIRIKTRQRQFIRPARLAISAASLQSDLHETDLQQMFERAHFSWEEPLSARSFAAWRDQLPEKSDTVPAVDNFLYKIQTSTSAGELHQATLILRVQDLQPMSETLEFASDTVEITAAPDEETAASPSPAPERAPARETSRPVEALSPFHRELQVFSALHKIGADLGEPVEMNPDGTRLLVTGTGLTAARKQQLRASLEEIPGVEIRFEDATPNPRASSTPADRATSATAPVQQKLQTLLGSRESVEDFTDRALDASDAMMARAHALRSLAKAFPPNVETSLAASDRDLLATLRHDHAAAFAARLHELRGVLEPVLSPIQTPPPDAARTPAWQDTAQALFAAAQNLDQLLNRSLAGSNADAQDSDFQRIAAALARVERAAGAIP